MTTEATLSTTGLRAIAWVRRACSLDDSSPALTGVRFEDGLMVATDGHRLHYCPDASGRLPGIWISSDLQSEGWSPVEGKYPDWRRVVTTAPPTHRIADPAGFLGVCQDRVVESMRMEPCMFVGDAEPIPGGGWVRKTALCQIWLSDAEVISINAQYLLDAMVGISGEIQLAITAPLEPVRIDLPPTGFGAIVMPVNEVAPVRNPLCDLTEFVEVIG